MPVHSPLAAFPDESWPVIGLQEYLDSSSAGCESRLHVRDGWRSPFADGLGFRHDYDEKFASGAWEFQQLAPGLCIAMADLVPNRPIPLSHHMHDQLLLSAMIEGMIPRVGLEPLEGELTRGYCSVLGLDGRHQLETVYERGRALKWVDIYIERRRFAEVSGLDPADMPAPVRDYLQRGGGMRCRPQRMSHAASLAAAQMKDCAYRGSYRRSFLTAKVREIACEVLFAMSTRPEAGQGLEEVSFSPRDQVGLERAMQLIGQHLDHPLGIAELAARCGLTRQKLQLGFRLVHGDTVGNVRDKLRMEQALWRIRESSAPIIEIALETGYQQATSFARAFKSVYGLSPMQMRTMARKSRLMARMGSRQS